MEIWNYIGLFAERNPLSFTLFVFILLDIATGLGAAYVEKNLASAIAFEKMLRKIVVIVLPTMFYMLEALIRREAGVIAPIGAALTWLCLIYEMLSNLENLARMGVYVPPKLRDALKVIRERAENAVSEAATTLTVILPKGTEVKKDEIPAPALVPTVQVTNDEPTPAGGD